MSKKTKQVEAKEFIPQVWTNANRNTCISYHETEASISVIHMDTPELRAEKISLDKFRADWLLIEGYNASAAAQKYLDSSIPRSSEVQLTLEKIAMSEAQTASAETSAPKKTAAPKGAVAAAKKIAAKVAPPAKKAAAKAAPAAVKKAAPAAKEAKPKKEASGRVKVDLTTKKIKLCKGHETKRFQEGSVRARCFALIKDGMTVPEYLKAVAKAKICEEPMAIDCLKKLSDPGQKTQTIELK